MPRKSRPSVPVAGGACGWIRFSARAYDELIRDYFFSGGQHDFFDEVSFSYDLLDLGEELNLDLRVVQIFNQRAKHVLSPVALAENSVAFFNLCPYPAAFKKINYLPDAEHIKEREEEFPVMSVPLRHVFRFIGLVRDIAASVACYQKLDSEGAVFFKQKDARAKLTGPSGCHHPGRPAADYRHIISHGSVISQILFFSYGPGENCTIFERIKSMGKKLDFM